MKEMDRIRENQRAWQEREDTRKRLSRQAPGHIYVLYNPQIDCYKIGWSKESVQRRLYAIRCASGCDVSLISSWEGSRDEEAEIHRQFLSYRHRGEWFHRVPATETWVDAHPDRHHGTTDRAAVAGGGK